MNTPAAMNPALPNALAMALDDEYRARATYQAVLANHGPVLPFMNIVQAEQRHIDALLPLFSRYGIIPPPDRWSGQVTPPSSLLECCEAGVAAEISNYQMYDALLTQVSEPDVHSVFMNLRNASAYHHLPAFEACAAVHRTARGQSTTTQAADPEKTLPLWLGLAVGAGLSWWLTQRAREA